MIYGSILSKVSNFYLLTADGIRQEINNNLITRLVLKLCGIPHIGLRLRAATILRFLNPMKSDVILDAGCGMGLYLLMLSGGIYRGYGVDIDMKKIKEASRLAKELSVTNTIFKNSDVINLDFPDKFFDKIICSEVLEHIEDDQKLMKEFLRVLKNKGTLIISTTSLSKINHGHKEDFSHKRIGYSPEQLKELFIDSEFFIEKILPYGLFFGQISWRINRMLLSSPFMSVLTFYPLILISFLDKFIVHNFNRDCIGYIIKLRKE